MVNDLNSHLYNDSPRRMTETDREKQSYFGYSLKLKDVQHWITICHILRGLHTAMVKITGDHFKNQRVHKNKSCFYKSVLPVWSFNLSY